MTGLNIATLSNEDERGIYESRMASNAGIISRNVDVVASYWLDNITVVSGEGTQYSGKKKLIKVWKELLDQEIPLFERIPAEIIISKNGVLAWERGNWRYTIQEHMAGSYAAMWRKIKGVWRTQSELFVSLDD